MIQEDDQPGIFRQPPDVFSVHADVVEVTSSREEVMILLGQRQSGPAGQEKNRALLKERVVMSPHAAKRLARMLHSGIQDYESRYGPVGGPAVAATQKRPPSASRSTPSEDSTEGLPGKAIALFQLVKNLELEVGYERSFKVFDKTLLKNRFLLGFSKKSLKEDPHEKILEICEKMDMPDALRKDFGEKLPEANYVHFGFEEDENISVYKAYLEFYDKIEESIQRRTGRPDSFLLHLGFKWDANDNSRRVLTRYTWYPFLSVENIRRRISDILDQQKYGPPFGIANGILEIASQKVTHHDILYLEVAEEGNPRKSFDINVYRANLQVADLYPLLSEMYRYYAISPKKFENLYAQIKTKSFGHLSGGISRSGADFLTVYYGVEGYGIPTD